MQRREGTLLQAPTLPFHFWLPLLPSHFCTSVSNIFFQHLFLLKQNKRIKNKEKKCREGRELSFKLLLCPLTFGFHFLPFASALLFQTFSPNIFFFSSKRKEKKKQKKYQREEKNAKKGGNLPSSSRFAFSLLALASSLLFLPFRFKHFLLGIFFFSSRRKERKTQRKKIIEKKKNAKKGRSLPIFFRFCIWDEVVLLLSPLHIPSKLSSPPSSSLVFHISSKLCATQPWELY